MFMASQRVRGCQLPVNPFGPRGRARGRRASERPAAPPLGSPFQSFLPPLARPAALGVNPGKKGRGGERPGKGAIHFSPGGAFARGRLLGRLPTSKEGTGGSNARAAAGTFRPEGRGVGRGLCQHLLFCTRKRKDGLLSLLCLGTLCLTHTHTLSSTRV